MKDLNKKLHISTRLLFISVFFVIITGCFHKPKSASYKPEKDGKLYIPLSSKGKANAKELAAFFIYHNPKISKEYILNLAKVYIQESKAENINWDIAFCQMCLETDYLRFGGQVKKSQNNFAGLGATDDGKEGAKFNSKREGVRAQIQHLKAYANKASVNKEIIDPRFDLVKRGSAEYLSQLGSGKWATDPNYNKKLRTKLRKLYYFLAHYRKTNKN